MGPPAADRAAARVRGRRRATAARARRRDRAAAGGTRAPGLGARGVQGPGGVERRARPRPGVRAGCRGWAGSARPRGPWRASWSSGVQSSPGRSTRRTGYVIPDHALIELARRAPSDREGLEQSAGSPPRPCTGALTSCFSAIERGRPQARASGAARPRLARARRCAAGVARAGAGAPPVDGVRRGRGAGRDPVRAERAGIRAAARLERRPPHGARLAPRAGRRRAA